MPTAQSASLSKVLAGLAAGLLTACPASALPQDWDITLIARSSDVPGVPAYGMLSPSTMEGGQVAINEFGETAILVGLAGGGFTQGVFVGYGPGSATPGEIVITSTGDPFLSPDLDYRGFSLAVFFPSTDGFPGPGEGLLVLNTLTYIVEADLPTVHPYYPMDSISLADDGTVSYRGYIGLAAIMIGLDHPGPPRQNDSLIATFDENSFAGDYLAPMMNGSKRIVSVEVPYTDIPIDLPRKLFTIEPSPSPVGYDLVVLDEATDEFDHIAAHASIAEDNRVAFLARSAADGSWSVYRRDSLADPNVLIGTAGPVPGVGIDEPDLRPAVNANGLVAYRAPEAGADAIYVGDGTAPAVRIAGPGDTVETDLGPLALGHMSNLLNGRVDINDSDQIAFSAWLDNGTIGLFVAQPAEAPGCNAADLAEPYGVLDLGDVQTFVSAFTSGDPSADLAEPEGVFDLADLQAFVSAFNAGCP